MHVCTHVLYCGIDLVIVVTQSHMIYDLLYHKARSIYIIISVHVCVGVWICWLYSCVHDWRVGMCFYTIISLSFRVRW